MAKARRVKPNNKPVEVSTRKPKEALEQHHYDPSTEPDKHATGPFTGAAPGK